MGAILRKSLFERVTMTTKSTEKAKALIELLSSADMDSAGLETLHILSGYPKPTITRIMDDLQDLRLVYRRLGDKRYVVLSVDNDNFDPLSLLARDVAPVLRQLHLNTGLLSDFVMVREGVPEIIESNFSLSNIRTAAGSVIGARPCPLVSAAGRALYAERTDIGIEPNADTHRCLSSLDREQQQGMYVRIDNTWEYGFAKPFVIAARAVPIRYEGFTLAALSLYADADALKAAEQKCDLAAALQQAQLSIESLLQARSRFYQRVALDLS